MQQKIRDDVAKAAAQQKIRDDAAKAAAIAAAIAMKQAADLAAATAAAEERMKHKIKDDAATAEAEAKDRRLRKEVEEENIRLVARQLSEDNAMDASLKEWRQSTEETLGYSLSIKRDKLKESIEKELMEQKDINSRLVNKSEKIHDFLDKHVPMMKACIDKEELAQNALMTTYADIVQHAGDLNLCEALVFNKALGAKVQMIELNAEYDAYGDAYRELLKNLNHDSNLGDILRCIRADAKKQFNLKYHLKLTQGRGASFVL